MNPEESVGQEESVGPEAHWQRIWTTRSADRVSWFESEPST